MTSSRTINRGVSPCNSLSSRKGFHTNLSKRCVPYVLVERLQGDKPVGGGERPANSQSMPTGCEDETTAGKSARKNSWQVTTATECLETSAKMADGSERRATHFKGELNGQTTR